jgi:hypothetical protein
MVAIDGSKFKAVNNRDKNFTPALSGHRQFFLRSGPGDRYGVLNRPV